MKTNKLMQACAAVFVSLLFGLAPAGAETISSWTLITNNGNGDIGGQFSVTISDLGSNQVDFHFSNNVGVASSITDIYFDDVSVAVLGSMLSLSGSAGVSFAMDAAPPNLPGGNTISFSADYSADSNAPVLPKGINASSEYLDIVFSLVVGMTFDNLLAQIDSGELLMGLHVQGIGTNGGSDSYVNGGGGTPPNTVPEPALPLLMGLGLLTIYWIRRTRRQA